MTDAGPRRTNAGAEHTGRSCPYCRFALKQGAAIAECGACGATHHEECWDDNAGCAILGCVGAPSARPAATPPAPSPAAAAAPPPPAPPPPPGYPPPPAGAPRGGGYGLLIAAVVGLAIVIGGGALAFVLASGGNDSPGGTTTVVTTTDTTYTTDDTETETTYPTDTTTSGTSSSSADDEAAIQSVLTEYYDNVASGDFDAAWKLLSPTYKAWKADNGGYDKWLTQEMHNKRYLKPSGLTVSIESFDPGSGVATINVTGMTLTKNGTCPFEGITWARQIDGEWYYDQGYLQNESRRAKWRPRASETLGVPCETDAY